MKNGHKARAELYRELAPLAEAAAIAYHILSDHPAAVRDPEELAEVRYLVARALASVGTILRAEGDGWAPLGEPEISERLYPSPGDAKLDGLFMRRVELLRAIEALRLVGFAELDHRPKERRPREPRRPDERRGGLAPVELPRDPAEDG